MQWPWRPELPGTGVIGIISHCMVLVIEPSSMESPQSLATVCNLVPESWVLLASAGTALMWCRHNTHIHKIIKTKIKA